MKAQPKYTMKTFQLYNIPTFQQNNPIQLFFILYAIFINLDTIFIKYN